MERGDVCLALAVAGRKGVLPVGVRKDDTDVHTIANVAMDSFIFQVLFDILD